MIVSSKKSLGLISLVHLFSKALLYSVFQGYVSVDLSPVAAVSVQLFSGDTELHVSGPIRISLGVPDTCRLQTSSVVPAWFFNRTTGE